jgi:hypothetical protein
LRKKETQPSVTHLEQLVFNHFYFLQASFNPIVSHFLHAIRARHRRITLPLVFPRAREIKIRGDRVQLGFT